MPTESESRVIDVEPTALVQVQRLEPTEFNVIVATAQTLVAKYKDAKFDLSTTKGDKEARAARMELVTARTSMGKAFTAMNKLVAATRDQFIEALAPIEKRIDDEIKANEKVKEEAREAERKKKAEADAAAAAEKARIDAANQERIAAIKARMEKLGAYPLAMIGEPSQRIESAIAGIKKVVIDPSTFEEFAKEAETLRETVLGSLEKLLLTTKTSEENAALVESMRSATPAAPPAPPEPAAKAAAASEPPASDSRNDEPENSAAAAAAQPPIGGHYETMSVGGKAVVIASGSADDLNKRADAFIANANAPEQAAAVARTSQRESLREPGEPGYGESSSPAGEGDAFADRMVDASSPSGPATDQHALFTAMDVADLVCREYGCSPEQAFQQLCWLNFETVARSLGYMSGARQ